MSTEQKEKESSEWNVNDIRQAKHFTANAKEFMATLAGDKKEGGKASKQVKKLEVLWGQPIKLVQVASPSELLENQRDYLFFFKIIPSHICRMDYFRN